MPCFEDSPRDDADESVGVEAQLLRSVIFPRDFLPDGSSEWARLHFAGRKRGFELVVGRMIGIAEGAEEHERPSFDGRRKAPSIWLRGSFEDAPRCRRIEACSRPRSGACERSRLGFRERALSGARRGPRLRVQRRPPMGFHATRGKGFRRRRKGAGIRYRRLPSGDRQGLAIVNPV
jgi:hypothetical protein